MLSDSEVRKPEPRRRGTLALMGLILIGSCVLFAFRLDSEPLFMDEAAFLSQSYFGDLFFSGRLDSPLWLEYPAYDLPPLPKYLINLSLRLNGLPRTGRDWMLRWYRNPKEERFVTPESLRTARYPSILLGAIGCVALMVIGTRTADRRVGFLAAVLLAINPLYMLHARRAMADVPAEAFVLVTLAVGLSQIRRILNDHTRMARIVVISLPVGVLGGAAVLTKLNGGLALMIVGAWIVLISILNPTRWRLLASCFLALVVLGISSLTIFVVLNPFVTANPKTQPTVPLFAPKPFHESKLQRISEVVEHRASVSVDAARQFPDDALTTIPSKLSALIVQGFGRFGLFGPRHSDSTKRFDLSQDWGAVLWLPLVLAGFLFYVRAGSTRTIPSEPSLSWCVPIAYVISLATVSLFLPLAWDRYFLPIQSGSCLLAARASVGLFDSLRSRPTQP